jgi:uncharacterized protein (TIGR02147 family)
MVMRDAGTKMKTDIFNYLDYRQYLMELTQELKQRNEYNVRTFASRAGIKTPGYMKMVIDGKRNLTLQTAQKFCRALNISNKEKEYFEKLILYNQTSDPDLKKEFFNDLMHLRPRSVDYKDEKNHGRYFSRPHYVSIQEMVALKDFKEDPKWIAKRCFPPIRSSEAKEAIETLLKLGLLKRDKNNNLYQTQKVVHTKDRNTQVAETYHYHEAVIDMSRHALGQLAQEERNYYALTLPMSKDLFTQTVDKLYAFRDQIIKEVQDYEGDFDEVYQMNFQLFPVTKKEERHD